MIHLVLPWLPPTSNHAYTNVPHGGRCLSRHGVRFKTETRGFLARVYRKELLMLRQNTPLTLAVCFYFARLDTKGYPKQAKSRYKKIDGSNRIKLLEDALCETGGIDDAQVFDSFWQKRQGTPERTEIWIWDQEREESPFDETGGALHSL